jgi:lysophospholipase L1-like esterase
VRQAAARILAILLGTVAAGAAAEGIARLVRGPDLVAIVEAGFEPPAQSTALAVRVPDGRVFGARPGYVGEAVRIDVHGTRGPDRPIERATGTRRVVVLGDSVAFGQQIALPQTMTARMETLLNDRSDTPWEVWNLAFPGYNTRQEAAALAGLGTTLTPDLLVVIWVSNDAASLEVPLGGSPDGPALYVERRVRLLPGLSDAIQIAAWQRSALFRSVGDAIGGPTEIVLEEQEHRAAIRSLGSTARALACPWIFAMFPPLIDYPGWLEAAHPGRPSPPWTTDPVWVAARQEAAAAGAEVIDLTLALAGHRPASVRQDEIHPNSLGHGLVAQYLVPHIEEAVGP